ncbi:unnamed protein product [Brassicogethes aeneus]|uniref:Ubiquinol-cytochrome c chaperone domain-containing protein n=1 Tax=Brassicogethes aeneus TaxID=1431903 RepID=A0A9P0B6T0_BRAAE|nr:unnamed protein product [Brassicogethes aeneus]
MNICRFPSLLRLNKLYQQQNAIKIALSGKNLNLKYNNNIILNRYISTLDAKPINKEDGLIQKAIKKITFAAVDKVRIKGSAYFLYEGIVDTINYLQFFEELDLPDTFYSWFVITELHIWMLSVRAMAEGQDGRHLRNCLVEALWADVAQHKTNMSRHHIFKTLDEAVDYLYSEEIEADIIALPPLVDDLTDEEKIDDNDLAEPVVTDTVGETEIDILSDDDIPLSRLQGPSTSFPKDHSDSSENETDKSAQKRMKVSSTAEMRDQIFELSEQLQAALLAYDEGIQSDDVVLAGAIWRRIFQQKNVDVKDVEKMVKFIRKQITLLDNYSKDQIFQEKRIKWEPLK